MQRKDNTPQKTKYDFIFGVGSNCATQYYLRKHGLQNASLPFDAVYGQNIRQVSALFQAKLAHFFDPADLQADGIYYDPVSHEAKNTRYINTRTGVKFIHFFSCANAHFDAELPQVQETFQRRCDRLNQQLTHSKKPLLVFINHPDSELDIADNDLLELFEVLKEQYKKAVHILCIDHDDSLASEADVAQYTRKLSRTIERCRIYNKPLLGDLTHPENKLHGNSAVLDSIFSQYQLKPHRSWPEKVLRQAIRSMPFTKLKP